MNTLFLAEGDRVLFSDGLQIESLPSGGQVIQDLLPILKRIIANPQSGDTIEVRFFYYLESVPKKAKVTSRTSWVADVTGGKSQTKLDLYRICVEQGVRTIVVDSQSMQRERSTGTEKLIAIGHPSR